VIRFKVNGVERQWNGSAEMPLLWYLRDELGLTGAKFGCGEALCGACTVHQNGHAVRACVVAMQQVAGAEIVTIEGLAGGDGDLHPVQKAWIEHNVPQCGYCQAGQIMQAAALLAESPHPKDEEILGAMAGNICRCGAYQRILAAVRTAAGSSKDRAGEIPPPQYGAPAAGRTAGRRGASNHSADHAASHSADDGGSDADVERAGMTAGARAQATGGRP
jgi:isoquinoline 1-oxidoreductase alpha subunit